MVEKHASARRRFAATAVHEGRWWIVTVPELTAVTQARSVREIDAAATGLISALLDLDPRDVEVTVDVQIPASAAETWAEAARLRHDAEEMARRSAELSRQAVRALVAEHRLTQVDAAALLGISQQRVQQLAH